MSSTTYVTVSLPISRTETFIKVFNEHVQTFIDIDQSHENIFLRLKNDGVDKYITCGAKGDMFGFSMEINYFNPGAFADALATFIATLKSYHAIFETTRAILMHSREQSEIISVHGIDEKFKQNKYSDLNFGYQNYEN